MTHHLLRVYYHEKKGDEATAALLRKLGAKADVARDLAYKLFSLSEKRKRSTEAQAYNALVLGWQNWQNWRRDCPQRRLSTNRGFCNISPWRSPTTTASARRSNFSPAA